MRHLLPTQSGMKSRGQAWRATGIAIAGLLVLVLVLFFSMGLASIENLNTKGAGKALIPGPEASYFAHGGSHTVVLKNDGTLWAWGDNFYGQLGDGTTTSRSYPMQVGTDAGWIGVAAGTTHTVALKSDGSLWAWGDNYYGQLGDGSTGIRLTPVRISSFVKVRAVVAINSHTLALQSNGALWAWGYNDNGQLGDGTHRSRSYPVKIGTGTDWSTV
ncbi:MAG: hypothetical protein O7A08_07845, partial [SAR324 cluster bacterium]|nr:hypothetical protein [SAR324 cluster bacterium]